MKVGVCFLVGAVETCVARQGDRSMHVCGSGSPVLYAGAVSAGAVVCVHGQLVFVHRQLFSCVRCTQLDHPAYCHLHLCCISATAEPEAQPAAPAGPPKPAAEPEKQLSKKVGVLFSCM